MTDKHKHERARANPQAPVMNIVTYVPKKGKEAELLALVKKHEPALRKVGLVTSEPFVVSATVPLAKNMKRAMIGAWFPLPRPSRNHMPRLLNVRAVRPVPISAGSKSGVRITRGLLSHAGYSTLQGPPLVARFMT